MKIRTLTLIAVLALAPATSWAAADMTNCRGTPLGSTPMVSKAGEMACWEFDDATDSTPFTVRAGTALICLDPDITTEGIAAAQIDIRRCHRGNKPAASPENECFVITPTPLTGASDAATQLGCLRVAVGTFYIDVTTSAAGDDAVVSILGEGS